VPAEHGRQKVVCWPGSLPCAGTPSETEHRAELGETFPSRSWTWVRFHRLPSIIVRTRFAKNYDAGNGEPATNRLSVVFGLRVGVRPCGDGRAAARQRPSRPVTQATAVTASSVVRRVVRAGCGAAASER